MEELALKRSRDEGVREMHFHQYSSVAALLCSSKQDRYAGRTVDMRLLLLLLLIVMMIADLLKLIYGLSCVESSSPLLKNKSHISSCCTFQSGSSGASQRNLLDELARKVLCEEERERNSSSPG